MSTEKLPPNPFTDDEAGLHRLLLEQAGMIGELSRESDEYAMRSLRLDEGIACLQWICARDAKSKWETAYVKASVVLRCLDELVAFGNQGVEPGWLKTARHEMGRRNAGDSEADRG